MILSLFRNKPADDATYVLYGAVVAQSRQPIFYAQWGVPDTVTGRFDMISLQLALVFRRLRNEAQRTGRFSQRLFDVFFKDMDRSLRELGAGDLAVPKKIQKMGNLFYGLLASLDSALAQNDRAALVAVLARNIYSANPEADPLPLADYVLAEANRLAGWPVDRLLAGQLPGGAPS